MADRAYLDWPFLEPRHKELALSLDDWAVVDYMRKATPGDRIIMGTYSALFR